MKKSEVFALLQQHQDPRGIKHWNERCAENCQLKSVGIGLTRLRKLAKQIGRDHDLAMALWDSDLYDAKIIALLIDDPKKMTQEQVEVQVEQLAGGHLAHVFSSCDATLAKTPFVKEVADRWMIDKDTTRRSCGYGLLYELSKSKKKSAPGDDYFQVCIERIQASFCQQNSSVQLAMGAALIGMGKRNKMLNIAALKVARDIGPIDFDPDGSCDPMDPVKHLTSTYLKEKLG